MSEERTYDRTSPITTQLQLHALVSEALVTGELKLDNRQIGGVEYLEFNLAEILLSFKQMITPYEGKEHIPVKFNIECPFSIDAQNTIFAFSFSARTNDTATIFLKQVNFGSYFASANFSNATFMKDAYFGSSRFQQVDFQDIKFIQHAYFMCSVFFQRPNFCNTIFKEYTLFGFAYFQEGADFARTVFEDEVNFQEAYFSNDAEFSSVKFKYVNFSQVTFLGIVNLSSCTFSEKPHFWKNIFTKKANFYGTTFEKESSFKEVVILNGAILNFDHIKTHDYFGIIPTVFNGEIIIKDPTLESDKRSLVIDLGSLLNSLDVFPSNGFIYHFFKYLNFLYLLGLSHYVEESNGKVNFNNVEIDNDRTCLKVRNLKEDSKVTVHFQDCGFYGKNVAFTKVAMQHVFIQGGNYVSGMGFYHCDWAKDRPWFKHLKYPHTLADMLTFRAMSFEKQPTDKELMLIYAHLKTQAVDAGDVQLSNDFHFWQQFYQGKFPEHKGLSWSNFYLYTSAYGVSALLPFTWFIVFFIWFTYIYGASFQQPIENNFFNGLYTSISASVPFVFNDINIMQDAIEAIATQENWWFYPIYILQHLIQGYLLFQIGAAIRNKVKR